MANSCQTFICAVVGVVSAGVLGSEGVTGGSPISNFFWSYFINSLREASTPYEGGGRRREGRRTGERDNEQQLDTAKYFSVFPPNQAKYLLF